MNALLLATSFHCSSKVIYLLHLMQSVFYPFQNFMLCKLRTKVMVFQMIEETLFKLFIVSFDKIYIERNKEVGENCCWIEIHNFNKDLQKLIEDLFGTILECQGYLRYQRSSSTGILVLPGSARPCWLRCKPHSIASYQETVWSEARPHYLHQELFF